MLNDLPPKIIQDHYCELSEMQKHLYDAFSKSQAGDMTQGMVKAPGSANINQQHVFQSLQYLRKLCNHPALVVKDATEQTALVNQFSIKGETGSKSIRDVRHAPKLLALRYVYNGIILCYLADELCQATSQRLWHWDCTKRGRRDAQVWGRGRHLFAAPSPHLLPDATNVGHY